MAKGTLTWKRVKFGEVAECVNNRVDDPRAAGVDRYVGLEHLDPESLAIRRWGTPNDVESTKLRFKPGDIIFGKRRAYQRKLAVADFEGICSAHAMVLRAKPGAVSPEFLPFFMQSDLFMERAVAISVGSLSPTINWKTLAAEEFMLPPLEEQRKAVLALRACEKVLSLRQQVHDSSFVLYRSLVDAGFAGRLTASGSTTVVEGVGEVPPRWRICTLEQVTTKIVDGVHKRPSYVRSGIPFLTIENLTRGRGIDFSDTRFVTEADHRIFSRRAPVEMGDVIVSKDGTLGIARVVDTSREFSIFVSLALLKPARALLDPCFLRYYFDSTMFHRRLATKASGSALKHIHLVDFRASKIPLPELADQKKIVSAIRDVDNAHMRALSGVAEARATKKAFLARLAQEGA